NSLESSSVEVHKQQQISLTEQGAQLSQIDTELRAVKQRTQNLHDSLSQQEKTLAQHSNKLMQDYATLDKALAEQQAQLSQFNQEADNTQQLLGQLQTALESHQQQLAQLDTVHTELQGLAKQLTQLQSSANNA